MPESKIAFLFPGQGSQRAGMGAPWVGHPSWRLVEEASELTGRDVGSLLLDADPEELKRQENIQLATFVLCLTVLDAVRAEGVEADLVAGHSLGEYTAICAAGVLSFADGVRAIDHRSRYIQEAVATNGGEMMAVIGLDDDVVREVCEGIDDQVWASNFNAPGQVVIAGTRPALATAADALKAVGARKVLKVPVDGAGHCPLLASAEPKLAETLHALELHEARIPVVSNVDARPHTSPNDFRRLLPRHVASPVLWRQGLDHMHELGTRAFVELGPGSTLTGMVKRTLPDDVTPVAVGTPEAVAELVPLLAERP